MRVGEGVDDVVCCTVSFSIELRTNTSGRNEPSTSPVGISLASPTPTVATAAISGTNTSSLIPLGTLCLSHHLPSGTDATFSSLRRRKQSCRRWSRRVLGGGMVDAG